MSTLKYRPPENIANCLIKAIISTTRKMLRIAKYKQYRPPENTVFCLVKGVSTNGKYCVVLSIRSIDQRKYLV